MSTTIQGGVGRVGIPQTFEPLTRQQLETRVALFSGDSIETRPSFLVGNENIVLPTWDPTQRGALSDFFSRLTPEQQEQFAEIGHQLHQALLAIPPGAAPDSPEMLAFQRQVSSAYEQYLDISPDATIDEMLNDVLYTTVGSAQAEVHDFATQLQDNLDAKAAKREEIADFRDQMAEWPPPQEGTWVFEMPDGSQVPMTKEQAESHLQKLEDELQTMSDMTPMMQIQLQDAMQKYTQAMQTLSNVMKIMHDTAMAIIRKIAN